MILSSDCELESPVELKNIDVTVPPQTISEFQLVGLRLLML